MRRPSIALAGWLVALLAGACMPLHVPAPAHVSLLPSKGRGQVGGQWGPQGLQLTGAYQATDHLVLRGAALAADLGFTPLRNSTRHYFQLTLGAGATVRHRGLRASINLDLAGASVDMTQQTDIHGGIFTLSLADYEDGCPYCGHLGRYGVLWRTAAQADVGYFWDHVALGAAVIGAWEYFDGKSSLGEKLYQHVAVVQPAVFVRFGPRYLRGELQVGLWLQPWAKDLGEAEQTMPLVVSLGLVSEI
ncbi:MAG: hypothetical protein QM765_21400 [Myxococcales bacterium]